jgi:hypothetical protein
MIIYEPGPITSTKETNGGRVLHGFSVVGLNTRPLVTFNYETEEEAAAAREQMRQGIAMAKSIVPHKV